jgi:formylglycine-generating enzyme required for sulfatase activity
MGWAAAKLLLYCGEKVLARLGKPKSYWIGSVWLTPHIAVGNSVRLRFGRTDTKEVHMRVMRFLLLTAMFCYTRGQTPAKRPKVADVSAGNPMFDSPGAGSLAVPGAVRKNPIDRLNYVWIPHGRFVMGCSPGDIDCNDWERPAHEVTITKGFWLGQIEVTQGAYDDVMTSNPSRFKGDDLPVEMVTWDDAQLYCQSVNGRLPTEAEWEYAARAGTTESRYGLPEQVAWFGGTADTPPHPGGQKEPNAWKLYDMLGNVWEWVSDYDSAYKAESVINPHGPDAGIGRPVRGGSLFNPRKDIRASRRYETIIANHDGSLFRNRFLGFRCAGDSR